MAKNDAQAMSFRLRTESSDQLKEMAQYTERSMTSVLELAIGQLHGYFERQRKVSEERATRGVALLKRLKAQLGDDFYKGTGGVAFELTEEGRVLLHCGGLTYFEEDNTKQLVAAREADGTPQLAVVEGGGLGEWREVKAGRAEPQLKTSRAPGRKPDARANHNHNTVEDHGTLTTTLPSESADAVTAPLRALRPPNQAVTDAHGRAGWRAKRVRASCTSTCTRRRRGGAVGTAKVLSFPRGPLRVSGASQSPPRTSGQDPGDDPDPEPPGRKRPAGLADVAGRLEALARRPLQPHRFELRAPAARVRAIEGAEHGHQRPRGAQQLNLFEAAA